MQKMDDYTEHDIYGGTEGIDLGTELEKLKNEKEDVLTYAQQLEADVLKLFDVIEDIKKHKTILTTNISSLLLTAQNEIKRKDNIIQDLRRQLDTYQLQHKIHRFTPNEVYNNKVNNCNSNLPVFKVVDTVTEDIKNENKDQQQSRSSSDVFDDNKRCKMSYSHERNIPNSRQNHERSRSKSRNRRELQNRRHDENSEKTNSEKSNSETDRYSRQRSRSCGRKDYQQCDYGNPGEQFAKRTVEHPHDINRHKRQRSRSRNRHRRSRSRDRKKVCNDRDRFTDDRKNDYNIPEERYRSGQRNRSRDRYHSSVNSRGENVQTENKPHTTEVTSIETQMRDEGVETHINSTNESCKKLGQNNMPEVMPVEKTEAVEQNVVSSELEEGEIVDEEQNKEKNSEKPNSFDIRHYKIPKKKSSGSTSRAKDSKQKTNDKNKDSRDRRKGNFHRDAHEVLKEDKTENIFSNRKDLSRATRQGEENRTEENREKTKEVRRSSRFKDTMEPGLRKRENNELDKTDKSPVTESHAIVSHETASDLLQSKQNPEEQKENISGLQGLHSSSKGKYSEDILVGNKLIETKPKVSIAETTCSHPNFQEKHKLRSTGDEHDALHRPQKDKKNILQEESKTVNTCENIKTDNGPQTVKQGSLKSPEMLERSSIVDNKNTSILSKNANIKVNDNGFFQKRLQNTKEPNINQKHDHKEMPNSDDASSLKSLLKMHQVIDNKFLDAHLHVTQEENMSVIHLDEVSFNTSFMEKMMVSPTKDNLFQPKANENSALTFENFLKTVDKDTKELTCTDIDSCIAQLSNAGSEQVSLETRNSEEIDKGTSKEVFSKDSAATTSAKADEADRIANQLTDSTNSPATLSTTNEDSVVRRSSLPLRRRRRKAVMMVVDD